VNWTYAIGEVVLIVVGVSIALAVNAWNERRIDRVTEREYLCRLHQGFSIDVGRLERFSMRLETNADTLRDLLSETDDTLMRRGIAEFAEDLERSDTVSLTWIERSTFDDLQSTGNLRLLRNASLRAELSQYFRLYELMYEILDEPVGPYKRILAGAMPGPAVFDRRTAGLPIKESDLLLGLQKLRSHPDFEAAVNAELSYTAGLLANTREFRDKAEGLTQLLSIEIVGADSSSDVSIGCAAE
jgi:hypothetical protein